MFLVIQRGGREGGDGGVPEPPRFRWVRLTVGVGLVVTGLTGAVLAILDRPTGTDMVVSVGLIGVGLLAILHALG